jgi:hypothetical protein
MKENGPPNFIPSHIMVNATDGQIYKTLMKKARISPTIIQHLNKMIDVKNGGEKPKLCPASNTIFQSIAETFDYDVR